ncbi:MAG: serine/threonine-protein kinase [Planctomycetota bacterium]
MISFFGRKSGDLQETIDLSDEPLAIRHLTEGQKEALGSLLEEYLTALESGVPPSIEELTQDCPELREALHACVDGLENLHRMAGGEPSASEASSQNARQLGDFELHEEIGRGGMGVVHRATQTSLRRTVAIKLLPLTSVLDSRQLTRFKQEAEAAASLHHPNIVPVYSVGCERGIHFYAMQFIQGSSLDQLLEKANRHSFGTDASVDSVKHATPVHWRTAIEQTAQVADGLHAAHELGIVHRDIKPSNLILDQDGKPWITDFGLARIQSSDSITQPGDVIGTMRYMSPEQSRGESAIVDGRTDVYSLGSTLYELLSGVPAFEGEDGPSILRQIDEGDFTPLRKRCPGLPRDLETVVAKAMANRRDDRYETAQEFSNDLRRVLADEPTIARPPTLIDHAVRLASKHRLAVLTSAMIVLLALAGSAFSNARLAVAKQQSDNNAQRAEKKDAIAREAIDRLGTQMADLLDDIPAADSVRHRLLSVTLEYYQRLAVESEQQGATDRDGQLDLAVIHGKIGSFQRELGRYSEADRSLAESQQRYATLAERFPDDNEIHLQWSISQNNLAENYVESGDFDSASTWYAKAIRTQNRLRDVSEVDVTSELATTLNNLGRMLTESENIQEAETVYRRAIRLLEESKNQTELRSVIQSNLAGLLVRIDPSRATDIARQSLKEQLVQLEADPGDPKLATQAVLTLNTLASAQAAQTHHREAIQTLQRATGIGEQLRRRWPDQITYRRDLAMSLNQLGLSFSSIGQSGRAADAFEQASQHARALLQACGDDAQIHSMLGSTLNNLAFLKQQLGDTRNAKIFYSEAIEHHRTAVTLAPQVPRYRVHLSKLEHNLQNLGGES